MNWYKTAQFNDKMVTIEQITNAIDKLIIEQGMLTSEDFSNALNETQIPIAKAAQVKLGAKPKLHLAQIAPKLEKAVLDLVRKGIFRIPAISEKLGIHKSVIKEILKKNNIWGEESRGKFYDKEFGGPLDKIIEKSQDKYEEGPTIDQVANMLETSPKVIKIVCKRNGISFQQLRTDRRRKIAVQVNNIIIQIQDRGDTTNNQIIIREFYGQTGFILEEGSLRRALSEIGKTQYGEKQDKSLIRFFQEYIWKTTYKSIGKIFEKYKNNPKTIIPEVDRLIERFFKQEGPSLFDENYGHLNVFNKNEAEIAKEIIYAKMQIQDFVMGKLPLYQQSYPAPDTEQGNVSDLGSPEKERQWMEYSMKQQV